MNESVQGLHEPSLPARQYEVHLVERVATLLVVVVLVVTSLLPPLVTPSWAQDVISQEEPQPEPVEQDQTAIDRLFKVQIQRPRPFRWVKEQLKALPRFLR